MAIYMQVDGISGSVTTRGFENWIELSSFQWGMSRPIGAAASGSTGREAGNPTIGEIVVTKQSDASSAGLFDYALTGRLDKKFTISFTAGSGATVRQYLKYELENVGLSQFSVNSTGEIPVETLSLNFSKVTKTFTPLEPTGSQSQTVGYDLTTMSKV